MTKISLLGVGLVLVFFAARALHGAQAIAPPPAPSPIPRLSAEPVTDEPERPAVPGPREVRTAEPVASHPETTLEREIRITADESTEARDLRHEVQLASIHTRAPELPAELAAQLLSVTDEVAVHNRKLRASFMRGEMSEDDYLDARRAVLRDGFLKSRDLLTKEQFARVYQWDSDTDPFDPDGAVAQGSARHD